MKDKKFRLSYLTALFAFVMLFAALSVQSVSAYNCGDFDYKINDDGYAEITGYTGKSKNEVVIPNDVDGYEVKAVANFDLSSKNVNRVVISEGIETIREYAFLDSEISEVVFPKSLRTIEYCAFSHAEYLYSCKFQEGLEVIGTHAFSGCPIQDLVIPNSVEEIYGYAFSGNKTKEITLPENLNLVAVDAFYSDTLETVTYSCNFLKLDANNNNIFSDTLKNVIVSEGVTNVIPKVFENCNLVSVKLPSTLKKIGENAFYNQYSSSEYKNLKKVVIPSSVIVIGSNAFPRSTVIYGQKGGVANDFATSRGNKFVNNDVSLMTYKYKAENVYTGKAICPGVTVTNLGYNPSYNSDYTVAYSNNIKIGTGKITIKGKGDFVGQKTLKFTIGYNIAKSKITLSKSSYSYNPNGVFPSATVKYGNKTLAKNKDYTITYKNNKNIGTASVVIKGIGSYVGTVEKNFIINPNNVSGLKVSSRTTTSLTLKWNKVSGVDGYIIYVYNSSTGKYDYVNDITGTSFTVKKLKPGTKYKYAVKAYKIIKSTEYVSEKLTTISTATTPDQPSLKVTAGKGKATLKWSKETCTGYEIYMKTGSGSYKKIATITGASKVSYAKSKLSAGKTYSFKVRAFKTVDGKNVYGSYSSAKSVKIK
ncbi:MAG: leucine-rich repeat protein [Acutalibacteraceae bacterium]